MQIILLALEQVFSLEKVLMPKKEVLDESLHWSVLRKMEKELSTGIQASTSSSTRVF